MGLPAALAPFENRQYRVLIAGLSASMVGAGMWAVAMVYQVIAIGGGAVELSVVATVNSVGMLAFLLVGGVAADRLPRRRILVVVEAANLAAVAFTAMLSVTGALTLSALCVTAFVLGVSLAFFYPAYSAILPQLLPARQLLAANGMEGTVRPVLQQAAGPALAGVLVAALTPGPALLGIAACHAVAFLVLLLGLPHWLDTAPLRHEALPPPVAEPVVALPVTDRRLPGTTADDADAGERGRSVWTDLREGVAFTLRTRWLFWTLCWAVLVVLLFIGPLEVLLPFLVRDQLGGGSQTFGFLLALYGVGAAAGSLLTASLPLPRRYLTVMISVWGLGMLPLAVLGYTDQFVVMAAALVVCSFTGGVGQVIWGTLLQRRVPPALLGRISSLDFFVSLALMPVSMALAGPVSRLVDVGTIFVVVAVASPLLGLIALVAGRLGRDEREHPLRDEAAPASTEPVD
ncbi:putative transporter [Tersicoccus solisilvae]|uniref:Transporter n=1 Tax=Tersicoccus solisilvae TaxID=1882339 RepID=A0ABQ1NKE9_9MICC|nr:MFS transporter [Tersicoccus solisilvae]GGC79523.1 putative transporter [Tersicoccus solisilvae]